MNYGDDDYPQGFDQEEEAFRLSTKNVDSNCFHPITTSVFLTSMIIAMKFNIFYLFSIYVMKNNFGALKNSEDASADVVGCTIIIANKMVMIDCDGQRHSATIF